MLRSSRHSPSIDKNQKNMLENSLKVDNITLKAQVSKSSQDTILKNLPQPNVSHSDPSGRTTTQGDQRAEKIIKDESMHHDISESSTSTNKFDASFTSEVPTLDTLGSQTARQNNDTLTTQRDKTEVESHPSQPSTTMSSPDNVLQAVASATKIEDYPRISDSEQKLNSTSTSVASNAMNPFAQPFTPCPLPIPSRVPKLKAKFIPTSRKASPSQTSDMPCPKGDLCGFAHAGPYVREKFECPLWAYVNKMGMGGPGCYNSAEECQWLHRATQHGQKAPKKAKMVNAKPIRERIAEEAEEL
ncbi:hypothetical protein F4778DRAFT_780394 [Xylariomycetidae sp. FL2044]|nr:hypothetical protein F4778DRAFT_780394 [Xylariomycetidae sp. FL2044]